MRSARGSLIALCLASCQPIEAAPDESTPMVCGAQLDESHPRHRDCPPSGERRYCEWADADRSRPRSFGIVGYTGARGEELEGVELGARICVYRENVLLAVLADDGTCIAGPPQLVVVRQVDFLVGYGCIPAGTRPFVDVQTSR